MTNFADFGLAAPIQKALVALGYETPTPIQVKAIPQVLEGHDLLGIAQTGTGKTAAFALPTLHKLASTVKPTPPRGCRALILSPTRELASQIAESFRDYGKHLRLSSTVVFGGVSIGKQEHIMRAGVDVLVATPGRLLDLIDRRALTLRDIEILVLDEADQMLDLGFIHALRRIVGMVPKQRQSLFFSATMPKAIADLAAGFLQNPVRVEVAPVATTAERVDQQVIFVSQGRKQALLIEMLKDKDITRTLVFSRTKHGADKVVKALAAASINSAAIHGNKSQSQRERALLDFKTGRCRVLVATDIAARGIDIDAVSHVFNFELPNVPEQYVHRIGRTARAGATGIAISFCNGEERAYLRDIEKLTRLEIPRVTAPEGFDLGRDDGPTEAPRGGRGRNGPRPQGDRPFGGRPQGERFRSDRPREGRPNQDRPRDDRPREDRPREDRPREDRPRQDRPFGERTHQERSPRRDEQPRRDAAPKREWRPEGPRQDGHRQDGQHQEPRQHEPRRDDHRRDDNRRHEPRAGSPRGDQRAPQGRRPEGRQDMRQDGRKDSRPEGRQDNRKETRSEAGNPRIGWLDRGGQGAQKRRPAR
ncbi:MAG: DEAD/DEAH box helicase [Bosea sp. (in: a-proteobacteria)]